MKKVKWEHRWGENYTFLLTWLLWMAREWNKWRTEGYSDRSNDKNNIGYHNIVGELLILCNIAFSLVSVLW